MTYRALITVCVSQDLVSLRLWMCPLRVLAGPASPGFNASTAGRHMWATSAAVARPAFTATDGSAWRTPRQVSDSFLGSLFCSFVSNSSDTYLWHLQKKIWIKIKLWQNEFDENICQWCEISPNIVVYFIDFVLIMFWFLWCRFICFSWLEGMPFIAADKSI